MARRETDLYEPVKRMLEAQGYAVKGEVNGCDLVARREDEAEPVIVELKTVFNLQLVYQLIDRSAMSPNVYAAVEYDPDRHPGGGTWNDAIRLCRKLGFGLIGVRFYKRKGPKPTCCAARGRLYAKRVPGGGRNGSNRNLTAAAAISTSAARRANRS